MVIFQVTIPTSGIVQITAGLPKNVPANTYVQQLIIQDNAGSSIRIGDTTVSSTKGILLSPGTPGGSLNIGAFMNYGSYLSDWWIAGTSGAVIDILYIQ